VSYRSQTGHTQQAGRKTSWRFKSQSVQWQMMSQRNIWDGF